MIEVSGLARLLADAPAEDDAPALLIPGELPASYGDLRRETAAAAALLERRGARGRLVALQAEGAAQLVVWTLAAGVVGAAVYHVPPGQPDDERERVAAAAGAHLAVTVPVRRAAEFSELPGPHADGPHAGGPAPDGPAPDGPAPEAGTVLFHTSGSSGVPKGVARSERSLCVEAGAVAAHLGYAPGDVVLCAVPLHHAYGFALGVTAVLSAGATLLAARPATPRRLAAVLPEHGVTVLVAAPGQYAAWAQGAVQRPPEPLLRLCVSSGAPLNAATWSAFREVWGREVAQQYGSSECGAISVDLPPSGEEGCVGSPYPGVLLEAGVRDRPGPVAVRSAHASSGYVPASAGRWPQDDPDGPLTTGDRGWIDERGRLRLAGRRSDLVNVHGLKVDPAQVAGALAGHRAVGDCAVVGVDRGVGGDQWLAAFVVFAGAPVAEATLYEHCKELLSAHKVPRRIFALDRLPLTASGKTDVRALALRAREG
ncbi:AMP-binding protein [Streptacidiphilus cavernicola]|uniref:AMP-binding protein n=1 Tax=Streptacidiphilus cavernicola TaxID=3342716 RepID=A0ABV6VSG0_9ACTN